MLAVDNWKRRRIEAMKTVFAMPMDKCDWKDHSNHFVSMIEQDLKCRKAQVPSNTHTADTTEIYFKVIPTIINAQMSISSYKIVVKDT